MARSPRDLVVRFLADVSGFVQGTDKAARALDDTEQGLEDVARTGEDTARDMAQSFDRAGDKIERRTDDVGRGVKGSLAAAGADAGTGLIENVTDAMQDGDITGAAKGMADDVAGIVGQFGPIGAAIGTLASVAGLVFGQMQKDAEKLAEGARQAFDEMVNGASRQEKFRNRIETIFGSFEDGLDTLNQLAEETGVSMSEITDALAEGGAPAEVLMKRLERMAAAGTTWEQTGRKGERKKELTEQAKQAERLRDAVAMAAKQTKLAADRQAIWNSAMQEGAENMQTIANQQIPAAARGIAVSTGSRTQGRTGQKP